MEQKKSILKSRTFWGAVIYAAATIAGQYGLITHEAAAIIDSVGVALGLWGARNARPV